MTIQLLYAKPVFMIVNEMFVRLFFQKRLSSARV